MCQKKSLIRSALIAFGAALLLSAILPQTALRILLGLAILTAGLICA